jgi:hypothetical protein
MLSRKVYEINVLLYMELTDYAGLVLKKGRITTMKCIMEMEMEVNDDSELRIGKTLKKYLDYLSDNNPLQQL